MYNSNEQDKWTRMVVVSLVIHLFVFSTFFLVPEDPPLGLTDREVVYEVDLVDISETDIKKTGTQSVNSSNLSKNDQAKRIYSPNRQKKTLTVSKRTVTKKASRPKKKKLTSSQMFEKAISNIKTKVKDKDSNYLEKAISELDKKAGTSKSKPGRTGSAGGVNSRFYKMQVETWVKSHWTYPVAGGVNDKLEAIIILKVNRDGTILNTRFIKRSNDKLFDEKVMQAIEKSGKVPPLPKEFNESYEEIEIKFNLKDLE